MLKSLFESSIDKLNIPADMKSAIKKINNICLEAEGDDKENDLGYTPLSEEDKKKAEQLNAEQERKEKEEKEKQQDDNVPTTIDSAKSDDDIWKVLNNLQKKAVKNRGTAEGEKWRQKLEDEYQKATSTRNFKRVKGLEMTIYNKGNKQNQTTEGKPEQSNNQTTEQPQTQAATSGEQQAQPNANAEQTAQPEANAEQQTQAAESSEQQAQQKVNGEQTAQPAANTEQQTAESSEQQAQQKVNGEQTTQPAANAEQQTQTAESNEQQAQNNAKPATTNFKKGADVATVQFFLKATKPQTNLVCDGILGPKTITAIQQTNDIIPSGKMDQKTQEVFNSLLAEAKQKVIPIQKQLGVTADGLIGKQTLGAMQKANMDVASVFNKKPTAPQTQVANNQGGNNANGAANQGNINLLDIKFDESKAQQQLKNKYFSQKQYNIWKEFGIAPVYQKRYPKETQNQIAQILKETKKQQEANAQGGQQQASQQKGGQQKAGQQNALKEDVAVKTPDKTSPKGTKENPTTEYVSGTVSLMNMPKDEKKVYDEEYQKSLKANLKPGKNEQIAHDTADLDAKTAVLRYRKNKSRPIQQQSAQQKAGQQNGKQNVQQQPQQVAKQGNVQPAQQGGQQNAKNNDYYSKTTQNGVTTTKLGGTVSYINLPPDEKKVYDDAEKKAIEHYIKKGNSEWSAMKKAGMNASAAVIRYRQRKAKKTS